MRLGDLLHPRASLFLDGRRLDRDAILRYAAEVPPISSVVEVPAHDPLTALAYLDAAWRGGGLPLPSRGVKAPRPLPPSSFDAALLLRTSGSTGTPRSAAFTGEAIRWSARTIADTLGWSTEDNIGLIAPADHGFGLVGVLLAGLSSGAGVTAGQAAFAEERAQALEGAGCTAVAAVPSVLDGVIEAMSTTARRRLRQIGSAGGPLTTAVAARLHERCPRATLVNQYGCTEAGPRLTACFSTDPSFEEGSVGRPLDGITLELHDGEVVFSSPGQMCGYLGDPQASTQARCELSTGSDGWRTGDLGRLDRGRLYLNGRLDDRVKLRGAWVDLAAVTAIVQAAGAREAFATTSPDHSREPRLIVLYTAEKALRLVDLLPTLPPGLVPRLVRIEALPHLPSGKLDRLAAQRIAESR